MSSAEVAARAARLMGEQPQGLWFAPGRVNLIGEHTDYTGGLVAPFAIPLGTTVAARARPDEQVRLWSEEVPEAFTSELPASAQGAATGPPWTRYVLGVLWALREAGAAPPGLDLVVSTNLPLGAGLSSSAALECAVVLAAADLADLTCGRDVLVAACHRAENEVVGAPSGVMDQSASLLCRDGHVLVLDTGSGEALHAPLDLDAHGLTMLVVDTGQAHEVAGTGYRQRVTECETARRILGVTSLRDLDEPDLPEATAALPDPLGRRVRHVVTENARVAHVRDLLATGVDPRALGPALLASHASLAQDYQVSTAALDLAVSVAMRSGAHGARLTGAGFGGSALALVDVDTVPRLEDALRRAFAAAGWSPPRCLEVTPSPGGSRLPWRPPR